MPRFFKSYQLLIKSIVFIFCFCAAGALWAKDMVSVAGSSLNLRSGPGAEQPVLYELKANFPLKVLSEQDKWLEVQDFEGDKGWVFREHTHKVQAVIVINEFANMRSGPSTQHKLVAKADYGDVFRVVEIKDKWVQVLRPNGQKAWILGDLLWGL